MPDQKRILIVEDDISHYELIERGFEKQYYNFKIKRAANLTEALGLLKEFEPDLIISDWKLPDGNGTDLIFRDQKGNILIPLVLMTSFGNEAFAVEAIKLGVLDYIVKSPEVFAEMHHIANRNLRDWYNIIEKRKLEENINKLSKAVEQSKVIVMITNLEGDIEYVNPKFENVTGYSLEEVYGKKPSILKSGDTPENIYTELWQTVRSGQEWKGEIKNKTKFGNAYWESVSITPIKDNNGYISNFIKIAEDITEKKHMEWELKAALDKAEESSSLKTSILSNMNHELRTPLMGILGMTELLLEEINDENHAHMLKRIKSSGKRLMNTLNSILDLSELESDKTLLKLNDYVLGKNVNDLLKQYEILANERNVNFVFELEEENIVVQIYERFFEQALFNIVDNAIKYTDKGSVKVTIKTEIVENKKWAKIIIQDTGIGIAEDHLKIIFDDFRQGSEGISRNYEGAGLGLTVSYKMIQAMNGNITVTSKINEGSEFVIWLPVVTDSNKELNQIIEEQPLQKETLNGTHSDFKKPSILSVEDNIINQEVTKLFLSPIADVDTANNGKTAVEKARNKKYSIILMDIHLGPGMDGIQSTQEIRKIKGYENTPIIAVTGYATSVDREKFLEYGLTNIIVKPFNKEDIIRMVKELLNNQN